MAYEVEFQDFSFDVKERLNNTSIDWLLETGNEIASHAQRNCKTDYEEGGKQLKGTYACKPGRSNAEVLIGSPLEAAFWEEFGTGSHADTSKNGGRPGRPGWWVYTPGSPGPTGYKSMTYYNEMEAMMMAAHIQQKYGKKAYASDGRDPNYTLENAFAAVKNPAIAELERRMKARMGT